MTNDDFKTSYSDMPLYEDSGGFDGSSGGGSWDYVAPEQLPDRPQWQPSPLATNVDVPEKIRQLVGMMRRDNWTITQNRAFYTQALFMADYKDDTSIVPFHCYYPTYHSMTIEQLRSYFTIRHLLRQGKYPDVPLSYLFVYVYELLMKVGCRDAEEAFELLGELRDNYSNAEPNLARYLKLWMRDFVVYNNLSSHIPELFAAERHEDAQALVLANRNKVGDNLLFQTVISLSNYNITGGALYKKQREAVEAVVPRVIRSVAGLLELRTHHRLETLCLGMKRQVSHPMFQAAIFYDPKPVREQEVAISLRRKYQCRSGLWTETLYSQRLFSHRGGPLGTILRETDRLLRISLRVTPKIAQKPVDLAIRNGIQQVINDWMAERAEAQRPKVTVDFTKLDRIRTDAAAVRDALLTDEERNEAAAIEENNTESTSTKEDNIDPTVIPTTDKPEELAEEVTPFAKVTPSATIASSVTADDNTAGSFSPEEKMFLDRLLHGGDWQAYLRQIHTPLGVMMDGINNKAMDWIGDVVLEDDGDGPKVIEDYSEDVEKEINK